MKLFSAPFRIILLVTTGSVPPAVAQPCQPEAPIKPTSVVFASREGTATLIGFDEFTPPSSPPKKYRRRQVEGEMYRGVWNPDASVACEYPAVPLAWAVGQTDDRPYGYPYGPITWAASLTPVSSTAAGKILYRAQTQISDPNLSVRIRVDLGNSGSLVFAHGEEKSIDPFAGTPPFNAVAECPGVSAWGASLTNASRQFVPRSLFQTRDVWSLEQEYSGADPTGATFLVNTNGSFRSTGRSFTLGDPQWLSPAGVPALSDYAGLVGETLTPTARHLAGSNTCVTGGDGYRRMMSGSYEETLSVEDTENDARTRAPVSGGTNHVAYQTSRGGGFTFSFCEVAYTVRFAQGCDGRHNLYVSFAERPHGSTGAVATEQRQFLAVVDLRAGEEVVSGTIRVGSGPFTQLDTDYSILRFDMERVCGETEAGSSGAALGSVRFWMNLGRTTLGESAGQLRLEAGELTAAVYTPAALVLSAATGDATVQPIKVAGLLRQVRAPQTLADITQVDAATFEVRFHDFGQIGAADPITGVHAVTGRPFATYRIENPDAGVGIRTRLRVTEVRGSVARVSEFARDEASQAWSLSTGGGLRTESAVQTVASGERTKTTSVRNEAGQIVTRSARVYRAFAWGEELVREILDPDGAALTTVYEYYDSVPAGDPNYQRMKQRTNPDGGWERFSYDASGRVVKLIRPFLDAGPATTDEALCRVTLTSYDTLPDADGDGRGEALKTEIVRTLGRETARRYEVDWSNPVAVGGDLCRRRSQIVCTEAGAAWNAPGNLVTDTCRQAAGTFVDRPRRTVHPDGTAVLTRFAAEAGGGVTTTIRSGRPNAAGDDIVDGRLMINRRDERGQVVAEQVGDLASGLTLSRSTATQFDGLGRPTRIEFDDGTFLSRAYACCGLLSERARTGVTTSYTYDALGRRVAATGLGLTVRSNLDADGRVLSVVRVGADGSEILRGTYRYDLGGRLIEQRDALDRRTSFAETFDPNTGRTTRTTTNPDGGTVVEVVARDGSLLSLGGTAVAPRQHEYGVEADGGFVKTIAVGGEAGGLPVTTEWVKHFTDFAGRAGQLQFADGATARSFYNAGGQLVRQVDPDGVTTLFAYNPRGERDTVAVDRNGNQAIDFAGPDRITRTVVGVATRSVNGTDYVVQRETVHQWETDGADSPVAVATTEQTGDGLRSWQTRRGLTTASTTVLDGSGGRTVTTTTPDGVKRIQVFRGERLLSHTVRTPSDAPVAAVTYAYDAHGRLESATDARRGTTTYAYNAADELIAVTTPDPDPAKTGAGYDSQTTTYAYDAAGRVESMVHPDGGVARTTYWPSGAVKRTWGARTFPVEYTYDLQGRQKTLTTWQNFAGDTGRAVTTWNYDPVRGWLINQQFADRSGPSYTYTASGRMLTRTWARTPAAITTYGYDAAGDLVATDYSDATPDVTVAYDRAGRPTTIGDASGVRHLAYHASGRLQDETYLTGLLNGLAVTRSFDALHRLAGLTPAGVTYAYDDAARLSTVSAGSGTISYAYYANSPLVRTVTCRQIGAERLVTTRTYDLLDRLSAIDHSLPAAGSALQHRYTYNTANQRTRVTREDGSYWSHEYDALGQVVSDRKYLAGDVAAAGLEHAWTYDDIGNRRTATVNRAVAVYTTNALNQYLQRTVPGVIDLLGAAEAGATVTVAVNDGIPLATTRQGASFYRQLSVDNASVAQGTKLKLTGVRNLAGPQGEDAVMEVNRLAYTAKTPETFSHDADGNLTADGRWLYTWDGENRLMSIETPVGLVVPGGPLPEAERKKLEFVYDGLGRRVAKKVSSWSGGAWVLASHTLYLYDGWNLLAELNALAGQSPLRTYVWGPDLSGSAQGAGGAGGLLGITDVARGAMHFAASDGNGNVVGLVRAGDGALSARYDTNAFGETVATEGAFAAENPFRFSTKFTDTETGHLCYGHRFYAPTLGRWLNRDPIGEAGGAHLYGMVGNDPVNQVDVLGLYDRDFHYYVIYLLLRAKCATRAEANTIAGFSQYVDDSGATEPMWNSKSVRAQWHFPGSGPNAATQRDNVVARSAVQAAAADFTAGKTDAAIRLGAYLHTYADSYAHEGFTAWHNTDINRRTGSWRPNTGHADADLGGHEPDLNYLHVDRTLATAKAIFELLPNRCCPANQGLTWERVERLLRIGISEPSDAGANDVREARIRRLIQDAFGGNPPQYEESTFSDLDTRFRAALGMR